MLQGQTQPFKVRYRVPLGGGAAEEVNVPYIASVNPPAPISLPLVRKAPATTFKAAQEPPQNVDCRSHQLMAFAALTQAAFLSGIFLCLASTSPTEEESQQWCLKFKKQALEGDAGEEIWSWSCDRRGLVFCIWGQHVQEEADRISGDHCSRVPACQATGLDTGLQSQVGPALCKDPISHAFSRVLVRILVLKVDHEDLG